jgi:hypothetical protein
MAVNVELEKICKGTDEDLFVYLPSTEEDAYGGTEKNKNRFSPADVRTKYLPIKTLERCRSTSLRSRNSKDRNIEQNYRTETLSQQSE